MIVTLLCDRCRNQLGPERLRTPSLARNALRSPAAGMARPVDPKAERIRAKKERKASLRKAFREDGIVGAVRLYLTGAESPAPPAEDCEDCLALMRSRTAA